MPSSGKFSGSVDAGYDEKDKKILKPHASALRTVTLQRADLAARVSGTSRLLLPWPAYNS